MLEALERHPSVEAVYSVGGGNTATVAAFERLGRPCRVFVAHDLDADNRRLLREGRIPSSCTTICAQTRGSRCR